MSSVETGQMCAFEPGEMSAAETGKMSAVETRQMYSIKTGRRPVAIVNICLLRQGAALSLSLIHISGPRDAHESRMPSSA